MGVAFTSETTCQHLFLGIPGAKAQLSWPAMFAFSSLSSFVPVGCGRKEDCCLNLPTSGECFLAPSWPALWTESSPPLSQNLRKPAFSSTISCTERFQISLCFMVVSQTTHQGSTEIFACLVFWCYQNAKCCHEEVLAKTFPSHHYMHLCILGKVEPLHD